MIPFVVPERFRRHPLVADRYFYTLPQRLLSLILQEIGHKRFEADAIKMEDQLSRLVGDPAVNVGIHRDLPIAYDLLESCRPLTIPFKDVKDLGWKKTEHAIQMLERTLDQRLKATHEPLRAYCGWLMTSRPFIQEHDALLRTHLHQLRRHGFPRPILASLGEPLSPGPTDQSWVAEFYAFCERWRLQSLAGPGLPRPLPVVVPSFPALTRGLAGLAGGTSAFVPEIVPVPMRGVLHEALEDAVHGQAAPVHLEEWLRLVGRRNTAKNSMSRYARLFGVQHYWRLLALRHPAPLKNRATQLRPVFGDYFRVGEDSIRNDLKFIARRLGREWTQRADPLHS
jgi:hypothetical protein